MNKRTFGVGTIDVKLALGMYIEAFVAIPAIGKIGAWLFRVDVHTLVIGHATIGPESTALHDLVRILLLGRLLGLRRWLHITLKSSVLIESYTHIPG